MRADDDSVLRQQLLCRAASALGEPVVALDLQLELCRERRDGVDAADGRARDDPSDVERPQLADERRRLLAATGVERTQAVVAGPLVRAAGRRVADDDAGQSSSSSGRSRS